MSYQRWKLSTIVFRIELPTCILEIAFDNKHSITGRIMTTIAPLGKRVGFGTYETFYDTGKYKTMEESFKANDAVAVDFVKDDKGVTYFKIYHIENTEHYELYRLQIQHFPMGVDMFDDQWAAYYANQFFKRWKTKNETLSF